MLRNAIESNNTVAQANLNRTNLRIQPQPLILNLRGCDLAQIARTHGIRAGIKHVAYNRNP